MADKLFTDTFVPVGGKRRYTVLGSVLAHAAIIAAAIMVPVMASDVIVPVRYAIIAFTPAPPLPPPMRPPTSAPQPAPPDAPPPIPINAPEGVKKEDPIQQLAGLVDDPKLSNDILTGDVVNGLLAAPPLPPVEDPPFPVGGDIQRPVRVKDAAPLYPSLARAARVEGVVIIQATIGVNGRVQDARILRSIPLLDAAALDAVRQWEYTPTRLNGTPVAVVMTVTVDFRLR